MTTTTWVQEKFKNDARYVTVHTDEVLTDRAKYAAALVERWALVAAVPDGEDSAGRAKLRLPTPDELVLRANEIVEALFNDFKQREWIIQGPLRGDDAD